MSKPPLTAAYPPVAAFRVPPPTLEYSPDAVLPVPPLTLLPFAVATLVPSSVDASHEPQNVDALDDAIEWTGGCSAGEWIG